MICTWNRGRLLVDTLNSLLQCDAESLLRVEILVVDNASTDDTRALVLEISERGAVRYCFERQPGLSTARNTGVKETVAPWVLFLDDDVIVEPAFLSNYLSLISRWGNCQYFGGPVVPNFGGTTRAWTTAVMKEFPWAYSCLDLGGPERLFEGEQSPFGANMCIRRDALLSHPFSTNFGYKHGLLVSGEESALFAELRECGATGAWSPSCALLHILPAERNDIRYLLRRAFGQGLAGGRSMKTSGRSSRWVFAEIVTGGLLAVVNGLSLRPRAIVHLMRVAFSLGILRGVQ